MGAVKTGTTTVQDMLAANRSRLRRHGYLYPKTPRGENGHLTAAVDFLRCYDGPKSPQGSFEEVPLAQFPAWRMGMWQRLVDEVRTDRTADVVISSEILCRFSKDMAAAVMAQIPAEHHEVVVVRRRPSSVLPSWYQEEVKRGWLPDFATYARSAIAKLASPALSEFDFLDVANLLLGAAREVRNRMLVAYDSTASGPRLQLLPEVAEALDAYVSGELARLPQFDQYAPSPPEADFDVSEAMRELASWQRMADAKWRTLDAASRLSRRGPLMRSTHERS